MNLHELCAVASYQVGVARRSDRNPAAREHALTPGGNGQYDHTTLCGGGRATKQSSFRGQDCSRCLALLRSEAKESAWRDLQE